MSDLFEIARIGLGALQQRLDATAKNAANVTTPGYRRVVPTQATVFSGALAKASSQTVGGGSASPQAAMMTDLTAGALRKTGNSTDVAIAIENAFFLVSDGSKTLLTRAGDFHVGTDGALLSAKGYRVQGVSGDISVPPGVLSIGEDGAVSVDGKNVGQIQLVRPTQPDKLNFSDDGVVATADAFDQVGQAGAVLKPGFVEDANTNQSEEMISLMTTVRQYESLIRASQAYDDMLSGAIQKLGDTQS
jgi:flagellar basal body rod protein FlgG